MAVSRRFFLKTNALGGLALATGANGFFSPKQENMLDKEGMLHIKPRYYRWHVNPGQEWTEANTGYNTLDWKIPVSQCALVLVDVWQRHYIREPEERAEKIIDENLIPLMKACRSGGVEIIHAPAPEAARVHPNWVNLPKEKTVKPVADEWPPKSFRNLSGEFSQYRRPTEPREAERQALPPLRIHPKAAPTPQEVVIADGEELHAYCKKKGILFLLFAGFNTNACILSRDYGTLDMSKRGYQVVLVRDCTTGMESSESQATLAQTNGAILQLEMFGQYTITSGEVLNGLS
jgi:nicotinamidase-related amidase